MKRVGEWESGRVGDGGPSPTPAPHARSRSPTLPLSHSPTLIWPAAFLAAALAFGLFLLALGQNPLAVLAGVVSGAFGSAQGWNRTIARAIPLLLLSAGLLVAFRAISALVTGMAQAELAGPLSLHAAESAEDTIARFRALPADRFPQLIGVASAAMRSTAEDEFEASIQLLLAGLEAG